MTHKRFFIGTLCAIIVVILLLSGLTAAVDPFFHYHAPLSDLEYLITNQRYQNDGILKNFDYRAIITGTSMTENFKASEWDALFDTNTVKVPFSGSYFKETTDRLRTAFSHNEQIDYVVRSLDFYAIIADKDHITSYDYPTYLYDGNFLNDTKYLLNKSVLFSQTVTTLKSTLDGNKTTSFDDCYTWSHRFSYGKKHVLKRYSRPAKQEKISTLTDSVKKTVKENLQQNIIDLANEYPDTEFYIFFPPYSIVFWDQWSQQGELSKSIDIMQYATELLLECDNIYLFSFNDDFDMICKLDNYKDLEHYGDWVNSEILINMNKKEGLLTKENYKKHFDKIRSFYTAYDYDAIFE